MKRQISATVIMVLLILSPIAFADIDDGLIAYYPFNGDAMDESENANDGTIWGALLTNDRYERLSSAFEFDGIDDYIDIPYSASIEPSIFSLSIWFKSSTVNYGALWTTDPDNYYCNHGYALVLAGNDGVSVWPVVPNGTPQFFIDPSTNCGDGSFVSGDSPLNDGKWHHIVAIYENSTLTMYVNGVLQQETEVSTYSKTNASVRIGQFRRTHNHPELRWFYKGSIDDIRLYNRAIHEDEIVKIYHGSLLLTVPSAAKEGDGQLEGTVRIFKAPNSDLIINLSIDDSTEISIPETVTIDANATSSAFSISIIDDQEIDDTQTVSIKAVADTYIHGEASIQVRDNDGGGSDSGGGGGGGGGGCFINSSY